jgi:tyrosyl-tRNA synthetase
MWRYYLSLTDLTEAEVSARQGQVSAGVVHPKTAKVELATRIVSEFHSPGAARQAAEAFEARFARGELRTEALPEVRLGRRAGAVPLTKVVVAAGFAQSTSEAARKIEQGGVKLDRARVPDPRVKVEPDAGDRILEVGRRAARVVWD